MLESGADLERDAAAAQGGGARRAAGGALRDPRALVRVGPRAVRQRAAPLRRRPHRRRRARGRARDRPGDRARPRRADRGLPHRPGGPRERAQARRRAACVGADRRRAAPTASCRCATTAPASSSTRRRRRRGCATCASARSRSAARSRCARRPVAARARGRAPRRKTARVLVPPRIHEDECDSTQQLLDPSMPECVDRDDAAIRPAAAVVCGRSWDDAPGRSLLCSVLLKPPAARHPAELTLVGALAVAETIEAALGRAAAIKWPNDVLVDGPQGLGRARRPARRRGRARARRQRQPERRANCPPTHALPAASLRTLDGQVRDVDALARGAPTRAARRLRDVARRRPRARCIRASPSATSCAGAK